LFILCRTQVHMQEATKQHTSKLLCGELVWKPQKEKEKVKDADSPTTLTRSVAIISGLVNLSHSFSASRWKDRPYSDRFRYPDGVHLVSLFLYRIARIGKACQHPCGIQDANNLVSR